MKHIGVLLNESVENLNIKKYGYYIDGTFGQGNHSKLILSKLGKFGRLIAIDKDINAVKTGEKEIQDFRFYIRHCSFSNLYKLVKKKKLRKKIDGILLDLGISSSQIETSNRGFSFMKNGFLDMRIDQTSGISAYTWLKKAKESEIFHVLKTYGEEKNSKKIARAIFNRNRSLNNKNHIVNTKDLSDLIKKINPFRKKDKHPATRSFQAIRIYINNELRELSNLLLRSLDILKENGRISIISFHSLENKTIKKSILYKNRKSFYFFKSRKFQNEKHIFLLKQVKKIKPSKEEISRNPRSRSAILRVIEKIPFNYVKQFI
ncbi:hypothetical protein AOQ88_01845 [Candidatus Riesia sp. GBBU]|nr:hypothetical protein AOQ88_01845 [Candidatus Riesia sp. GBBU]